MHIQLHRVAFIIIFIQSYAETKPVQHYGICSANNEEKRYCLPAEECATNVEEYLRIDGNNRASANSCSKHIRQDLVCCQRQNVRNDTHTSDVRPMQFNTRFGSNAVQLLQPPACGTSLAFRIYFGKQTQIDEFPWTAALMYTSGDGVKKSICGGVLIDKRWVITAAHCVIGRLFKGWNLTHVRLGEWNFLTNPDCELMRNNATVCAPPHVEIPIDKVLPHERFNKSVYVFSNDIALLRLAEDVQFTQYIKPLCLPLEDEERNDLLAGSEVDVAGWGRTENDNMSSNIKLKAKISIWNFDNCVDKFFGINLYLENSQMCGTGLNGSDTCSGDSGGPIMMDAYDKRGNAFSYLAGIVSYGHKHCATPGFPAVYTRVGAHIDWIKSTISSNS